jgi:hypothetical protein
MKRRERLSGSKHGKVSAFAQRQQPRGLINLGAGQAETFSKIQRSPSAETARPPHSQQIAEDWVADQNSAGR